MPEFFATAAKGLGPLLAGELAALDAEAIVTRPAGVAFEGSLACAYRACLWSRVASRVLLPIGRFEAESADALYAGINALPWHTHFGDVARATLAVDFTENRSAFTHTHYGALKVKDAIVDALRARTGDRPSIDTARPSVRVNVFAAGREVTVSIDLSGESLHRRGYRVEQGAAPLKENLAAAIVLKSGWPAVAAAGGAFVDPMCGAGTLVIEAALIAFDLAPGLLRDYFGFLGWAGHDAAAWARERDEARARAGATPPVITPSAKKATLVGFDADARAIRTALANAERAGLHGRVHFEKRDIARAAPPPGPAGVVVVNPPYGERLGDADTLKNVYGVLGDTLKQRFGGYTAYVLTSDKALASALRLRAVKRNRFYNGALACELLTIPLAPAKPDQSPARGAAQASPTTREAAARPIDPTSEATPCVLLTAHAEMFANRLQKNLKHLSRWAAREGVTCYRVYDADLPEYAVAVDRYEGYAHVQEYAPPKSVVAAKAEARLRDVMAVVPEALGVDPARVFLKVRERQRGGAQYERQGERGAFVPVGEGGLKFWVNFTDYLDTGLFLDHRPIRARLGEAAAQKRFLNLFCYTGAATVYAAAGGAAETLSIDMSRTYLDWAERNLALNGIGLNDAAGPRHRLLQADCLAWLREPAGETFDLIFLDPPTFSNSKRMRETLDVQRDHVSLIAGAAARLAPGGVLFFSTNHQRFKLDRPALAGLAIEDISAATIPFDFARNPRIHRCYRITRG